MRWSEPRSYGTSHFLRLYQWAWPAAILAGTMHNEFLTGLGRVVVIIPLGYDNDQMGWGEQEKAEIGEE